MSEPCVIRETASGYVATTLADEAFQRREIELVGTIDRPVAMRIVRQMRYLAEQDADAPITLLISSGGGEVVAGLAIYDVMQALPCPTHTVCVGEAASMAALLMAAGSRRMMLPSANVMIHDPLIMGCGGSALSIEEMTARLMQTRRNSAEILAKHTGHIVEEILEKTVRDTWFSAQEAVDFGLADEIITKW